LHTSGTSYFHGKSNNMKRSILIFALSFILISSHSLSAQDTFSIVAVDSITGEVGSAGASCVNLFNTPFSDDTFIGVLFPGKGAINSQAYYIPANQDNATARMNAGDSPQEIIDWLIANDVQGNPTIRQYGIAAIVNGSPQAVGYTGTNTDDYKGHIAGTHYAIQGNILLGQEVLDSMEAQFLRAEGDLACKLMAALQGANVVGADTRCAPNGSSSLFAYVKVAQPDDNFGDPSFKVSVRTRNGDGIEPIDSLQVKFDAVKSCGASGVGVLADPDELFTIFPNPARDRITLQEKGSTGNSWSYTLINVAGVPLLAGNFSGMTTVQLAGISNGLYYLKVASDQGFFYHKIIKQ
jgi:uncharacterized Ntn-hydrolase superfamily protein